MNRSLANVIFGGIAPTLTADSGFYLYPDEGCRLTVCRIYGGVDSLQNDSGRSC